MYKLQGQDLHCSDDQKKHERRHDKLLSHVELAWTTIRQIWMQGWGIVLVFNFNKLHLSDFIVGFPVTGDAEKQWLWGHNSFVLSMKGDLGESELCTKGMYFPVDGKAKKLPSESNRLHYRHWQCRCVNSEVRWIPADNTGGKHRLYRRERLGPWQSQVGLFLSMESRTERNEMAKKKVLICCFFFFKEINNIVCGERRGDRKCFGILRSKSWTYKRSQWLSVWDFLELKWKY